MKPAFAGELARNAFYFLTSCFFISFSVWAQNPSSPVRGAVITPTRTSTPSDTPTPAPLYSDYSSAYNAGAQAANENRWKDSLIAFQTALNYATSFQTRSDCRKGLEEAKAQLKNALPTPTPIAAIAFTPTPAGKVELSPLTGLRLGVYYYKLHDLKMALSEVMKAKPKSLSQKTCRYFILYRIYVKKAMETVKQQNVCQRAKDKALRYKTECQELISREGNKRASENSHIKSLQKSIDPIKEFLDCCDEGKGNCGDIPEDI